MPIPYKAEFFDRDFGFRLFAVIPEPEIVIDYLTLDKSSIIIPGLCTITNGWYCHITQGREIIFQGVVHGTNQTKQTTEVQLKPLFSMFDVQVYVNRSSYGKRNLEGWMAQILSATFINSDDNVQNISGLNISAETRTDEIALNLEDNIHDFWNDIAKKALENGKIAIDCSLDISGKKINTSIVSRKNQNEVTIEADLPNVIEQNFSLRDNQDCVNKCIIINQENESEQAVFYADDYSAPTVCRIETITVPDKKSFSEESRERASELMKQPDYNNLIELTYQRNDRLIPSISIGQPCKIIKNDTVYHSVLTGIALKQGRKTLVFGGIRVDLTKILKLKGSI